MHNLFLKGTGVALITPFNEDFSIDFNALEKTINHLIYGKVDYIVLLGTTAETATLSKEEKKQIIHFCKDVVESRIPLVLGLGGNNTMEVVNEIKSTDFSGFSAILSVSPYYNKPTQEGIYQHYKAIAEVSPVPVILYNVPGRTGSNMHYQTTLKLANDFKNIVAIKEASGNFEQCMEIINNKQKDFIVISGDDLFTYPLMTVGMEGVISVAAHAEPLKFSEMVRKTLKGDFKEALELHYDMMEMMQLIFQEGNPGGIKALLSKNGLCKNIVRLPLMGVSDILINKLNSLK